MTRWFASLGPGLMLAAAAIGVSHLVQSTRAGADGRRTTFNSFRSIAGRLVGRGGNLRVRRAGGAPWDIVPTAAYLLSNLVSRREIHAKQGRRLGAA